MTITISNETLKTINYSEKEFLIDMAVYFYDKEIMSMGQACKLAGLDQLGFQEMLAKKNVFIKYGLDELYEDLREYTLIPMMVISDTTTITNLWKINELELLKMIYIEVLIPQAVYLELSQIKEQEEYILICDWIKIETPHDIVLMQSLENEFDIGEIQAIALSIEKNANLLIFDELRGRKKAKELGIKIIGELIGVLLDAKKQGVISAVRSILNNLIDNANFYINPLLYNEVLKITNEL